MYVCIYIYIYIYKAPPEVFCNGVRDWEALRGEGRGQVPPATNSEQQISLRLSLYISLSLYIYIYIHITYTYINK